MPTRPTKAAVPASSVLRRLAPSRFYAAGFTARSTLKRPLLRLPLAPCPALFRLFALRPPPDRLLPCLGRACTRQPAHDAEVLCLAYSPMMVPSFGGRGATPPPLRSPPDGGGRGVSGGEEGKHGTGETKTSAAAEGGAGTGASAGVSSSSPLLSSMFSASAMVAHGVQREGKTDGRVGVAGGARVGAGAAKSVSSWEAVDPLDPAGAAEKMLSLSFISSLSSLAAPTADRNGDGGAATAGGGGSSRPDADGQGAPANESGVLGERTGEDGLGTPSVSEGDRRPHDQHDCCAPLVLLASASRDSLVHVFDASLSSRRGATSGGRGGAEAATAAALTASASSERGGARVGGGGGVGGATTGLATAGGVEARLSGNAIAVNTGARGTAAAAAAGFPLLKTLDSHSGSVTAVKFSKDGKRCVPKPELFFCLVESYFAPRTITRVCQPLKVTSPASNRGVFRLYELTCTL